MKINAAQVHDQNQTSFSHSAQNFFWYLGVEVAEETVNRGEAPLPETRKASTIVCLSALLRSSRSPPVTRANLFIFLQPL